MPCRDISRVSMPVLMEKIEQYTTGCNGLFETIFQVLRKMKNTFQTGRKSTILIL